VGVRERADSLFFQLGVLEREKEKNIFALITVMGLAQAWFD
jgi:hypothetical protein